MTTGALAGVPTASIMKAPLPMRGFPSGRGTSPPAADVRRKLVVPRLCRQPAAVLQAVEAERPSRRQALLEFGIGQPVVQRSAASNASFGSVAPARAISASVACVVAMQSIPSRARAFQPSPGDVRDSR